MNGSSAFVTVATQDGTWLATDPLTGISASGRTLAEAVAELLRLLTIQEAA